MVSSRPPRDKRFSGDERAGGVVDFEAHLNQFELATEGENLTDRMRFVEMGYWFMGSAGQIVSMYDAEPNASVALRGAKDQLRREFGSQSVSASMMLDDLLAGKKIQEGETKRFQQFVLSLQKVYMKAKLTDRKETFHSPDVINMILRKKFDHLAKRWVAERVKVEEKWEGKVGGCKVDMDFEHFLTFLKRQQKLAVLNRQVAGVPPETPKAPETAPKTSSTQPTPPSSVRKLTASLHALDPTTAEPKAKGGPIRPKGAAQQLPSITPKVLVSAPSGPEVNQDAPSIPISSKAWKCTYCELDTYHPLTDCPTFRKRDAKEKFLMIKAVGVCAKCFTRGHVGKECTAAVVCEECGGRHHTLMHESQPGAPVPQE